ARADDPDLGDRLGELLVWGTRRLLRALLHEVERVDGCAELVARDEIGERLILGEEARRLVGVLRRLQQLERLAGALRDLAGAALARLPGETARAVPLGEPLELAGLVRPRGLPLAREHAVRPDERLLEEVRGAEHGIRDAEFEGLRPLEHPVV